MLWRDSTIIIGQFFSVLFKMLLREEASFIEVTLLTKTYSLDYEFGEKSKTRKSVFYEVWGMLVASCAKGML